MKTNGFSSGAAHAARRRDDEPKARLRDSSSLDVSGGVPDSARGVDAAPGVADMSEVQVEDGKRCAACNENGITRAELWTLAISTTAQASAVSILETDSACTFGTRAFK